MKLSDNISTITKYLAGSGKEMVYFLGADEVIIKDEDESMLIYMAEMEDIVSFYNFIKATKLDK